MTIALIAHDSKKELMVQSAGGRYPANPDLHAPDRG